LLILTKLIVFISDYRDNGPLQLPSSAQLPWRGDYKKKVSAVRNTSVACEDYRELCIRFPKMVRNELEASDVLSNPFNSFCLPRLLNVIVNYYVTDM
jgi:hypothetical protein